MPRVPLPITNGYYVSRSRPVSNQTCKNLYVHINQRDSLASECLYGTAGARQLATSGDVTEANRGAHEFGGIPYFVNGTTLYRLDRNVSSAGDESFSLTSLGTVEGSGRVSMEDNGSQLCILIPNGKGYIYQPDAGTPFQEITDPDFRANGNPQFVRYVDGYFVFTTDQDKFIISALNDGLSYNALDFGSAEADPDGVVVPIVLDNELFIAGGITIEPFRNVGGADFPFQRLEGAVISVGVDAPFSMVRTGQTFMFIGGGENEGPSVYAYDGSQVQPISTDAINVLLEELTPEQLQNVFGWFYSEGGARFVGWTLPSVTIVYDITSGRWHERSSFDIIDNSTQEFRYRVNSVVQAYNRILVGDFLDGRIGELGLDIYDEYGNNIIREITTQPFNALGERLLIPSLEVVCEAGVGNRQDADPRIAMQRSVDGQRFTPKRYECVGRQGDYEHRAIFRRLGRAPRMELIRFTMSDKVKWVVIAAWADVR